MLKMSLIDPRQTVHIESGSGLDAIGAMNGVDLPRDGVEMDADYRVRLTARLWEPLMSDLNVAVATGEYLDEWCFRNSAPADLADDTKPSQNHVRDAVRANQ